MPSVPSLTSKKVTKLENAEKAESTGQVNKKVKKKGKRHSSPDKVDREANTLLSTPDVPRTVSSVTRLVGNVAPEDVQDTLLMRLAGKPLSAVQTINNVTEMKPNQKESKRENISKNGKQQTSKSKKQTKANKNIGKENKGPKENKGHPKEKKCRPKESKGVPKENKAAAPNENNKEPAKKQTGVAEENKAMEDQKDIINAAIGEELTDLYGDLDEESLNTFRELFNMLDQSHTGIITADNLYEELRRVDSEVTYTEVEEVLKQVDKDGDGTIDFDEFVYHMAKMAETEGNEDEVGQKFQRRQRLLYSAITRFSIKQTLADIQRTLQIRQAPHVLSHYTAGVRLIGLTTRQLERQFKKMQKSAAKNDSPYAKPLNFAHIGAEKSVHRPHVDGKPHTARQDPHNNPDVHTELVEAPDTVAELSHEIQRLFTHRGSVANKLPDAQLLMELRQKIGTVSAQLQRGEQMTDHGAPENMASNLDQRLDNPKVFTFKTSHCGRPAILGTTKAEMAKHSKTKGWAIPRIGYFKVPLPELKMSQAQKPTYANLASIRAKARAATERYYSNLRQTEINNAMEHWEKLYADVIKPRKLFENFRTVFHAYSPHREEEAFVVGTYMPGPFIYTRPNSNPGPITASPNTCTEMRQHLFNQSRKTNRLPGIDRVQAKGFAFS